MTTTQPSTAFNLAAIAGDAHTALAYGKDVADLLTDTSVQPDEADLLAAAIAVALQPASRSVEEVGALVALDTAAHVAAEGLAALRGWSRVDALEKFLLAQEILEALVFQFTDIDEQD